jgi:hypothetical protein
MDLLMTRIIVFAFSMLMVLFCACTDGNVSPDIYDEKDMIEVASGKTDFRFSPSRLENEEICLPLLANYYDDTVRIKTSVVAENNRGNKWVDCRLRLSVDDEIIENPTDEVVFENMIILAPGEFTSTGNITCAYSPGGKQCQTSVTFKFHAYNTSGDEISDSENGCNYFFNSMNMKSSKNSIQFVDTINTVTGKVGSEPEELMTTCSILNQMNEKQYFRMTMQVIDYTPGHTFELYIGDKTYYPTGSVDKNDRVHIPAQNISTEDDFKCLLLTNGYSGETNVMFTFYPLVENADYKHETIGYHCKFIIE